MSPRKKIKKLLGRFLFWVKCRINVRYFSAVAFLFHRVSCENINLTTHVKAAKTDLLYVHTYQPQYRSVALAPGFGDFLKGSMAVGNALNSSPAAFDLELGLHPVSQFLANPGPERKSEGAALEFFNEQSINLDSYLSEKREPGVYPLVTNLNIPYRYCIENSRVILPRIELNSTTKHELNRRLSQLSLDCYYALHIRIEDAFFHADVDIPRDVVTFLNYMSPESRKRVLVISNNLRLKQELAERFSLKFCDGKSAHLGGNVDDKSAIMDTLLDFHMIARSAGIIQFSQYGWGSGFSDSCAALYNIPILRFQI